MELISTLPTETRGQVRELWRVPDGRLVELSTVGFDVSYPDTPTGYAEQIVDRAYASLSAVLAPGFLDREHQADLSPREETMAFLCDEQGRRISADALAAAQGEGSRQRVLDALAAGVD